MQTKRKPMKANPALDLHRTKAVQLNLTGTVSDVTSVSNYLRTLQSIPALDPLASVY